ncbi:hypothetical protein Q9233_004447 [Columba guinea]|nr:hypothetical protein Q9233_004447 [Columba guinea]
MYQCPTSLLAFCSEAWMATSSGVWQMSGQACPWCREPDSPKSHSKISWCLPVSFITPNRGCLQAFGKVCAAAFQKSCPAIKPCGLSLKRFQDR